MKTHNLQNIIYLKKEIENTISIITGKVNLNIVDEIFNSLEKKQKKNINVK